MHNAAIQEFLRLQESLPTFGAVADLHARQYVALLRRWMAANRQWSAVSSRYQDEHNQAADHDRPAAQLNEGSVRRSCA
jgi:hypothetical protein